MLGDIVGYGADPNAVIDRIAACRRCAIIRGNHDKVASGLEDADGFNLIAQRSRRVDAGRADRRRTATGCAALPTGPLIVDELVEICHGSPVDEDEYIFDELDAAARRLHARAAAGRASSATRTCRWPDAQRGTPRLQVVLQGGGDHPALTLAPAGRYLINPGSVGQPRDGDPRAAFAALDTGTREVTLRRVAYPVEQAQAKILAAGLPKALAQRLAARPLIRRSTSPRLASFLACSFLAAPELHGKGVAGGTRTEDPADYHARRTARPGCR